jgi:hypothetical protein
MDFITVSAASLTDDVITLTVATLGGLRAGDTVTVAGVNTDAQPHFDGTKTLTGAITTTVDDVTTYTVTYAKNHPTDIPEFDCDGRLTPVCTWVDSAQVEGFLGVSPASEEDEAFLDSSVEAGNDWAYRRRAAAGYDDWYSVVPNHSAQLGTVLYAASLYRQRGSVDSFASFQDMAAIAPIGSNFEILKLLGINKPAAA